MITAKILAAFVYAEATSVVSDAHAPYNKHIQKEKDIKQWMAHINLDPDIQRRVLAYYDILWNSF
jgi:hypothetical protein